MWWARSRTDHSGVVGTLASRSSPSTTSLMRRLSAVMISRRSPKPKCSGGSPPSTSVTVTSLCLHVTVPSCDCAFMSWDVMSRRLDQQFPAEIRGQALGELYRPVGLAPVLHQGGPDPRPGQGRAVDRMHQLQRSAPRRPEAHVGPAGLVVPEPADRAHLEPAVAARGVGPQGR